MEQIRLNTNIEIALRQVLIELMHQNTEPALANLKEGLTTIVDAQAQLVNRSKRKAFKRTKYPEINTTIVRLREARRKEIERVSEQLVKFEANAVDPNEYEELTEFFWNKIIDLGFKDVNK